MGEVWVARHLGLGTDVAVKFIRDERDANPSAAARFAREAAAAARVRSAHVVQVLDHGVSGGSPFIVMELLRGHDLRALLAERGALSAAETVTIVRQLSKALEKTHAEGLIHRDVKPSNIFLVDGEGDTFVKLLDFGLARGLAGEESSQTTAGAGTPAYMSPEQIAGEPLDARSDVWSIGVVGFECLTGHRPFEGETVGALALAIHGSKLPSIAAMRPGLPTATDVWFSRACARNVSQRFSSPSEAGEALSAALEVALGEKGLDTPVDSLDGTRSVSDTTVAPSIHTVRRHATGPTRMTWVGVSIVISLVAATSRGALLRSSAAAVGATRPGPEPREPETIYARVPRMEVNTPKREPGSATTATRTTAARAVVPVTPSAAPSAREPWIASQASALTADSAYLPDERR